MNFGSWCCCEKVLCVDLFGVGCWWSVCVNCCVMLGYFVGKGIIMEFLLFVRLGVYECVLGVVDFGLFLFWVLVVNGNWMWVKIIYEID